MEYTKTWNKRSGRKGGMWSYFMKLIREPEKRNKIEWNGIVKKGLRNV
jgi:hypothetical protein